MIGWRKVRGEKHPSGDLAEEVHAYLSGHYVQYLDQMRKVVPSWAWLNLLAHGDESDLVSLAKGDTRELGRSATRAQWFDAVSFLASEALVAAQSRSMTLHELQLSSLIPLEIWLAGRDGPEPLGANVLIGVTLSALYRHPSSHR